LIELGILLALACALGTNVAFLCKHRGAVAAPAVGVRHPWRSAVSLFRSRWWAIGMGIATLAWALHVAALALAPLSLVQMVISGGLVLLAYPAERWFGFKLGRREWTGLGLSAAGLGLLAITTDPGATGSHSNYALPAMLAFEVAMVGVGVALLASHAIERVRGRSGELLGVAAGLLVGASDVALKALTATVPADPLSLLGPWTLFALVASVLAFFAIARGLQVGEGIAVIALSSVAANCAAILGGILVFGDPVGENPLGIILRSAAFVSVIVAAALMPGPLRAARV
jgi:drug/metabolite transporter (DMT)-like permease